MNLNFALALLYAVVELGSPKKTCFLVVMSPRHCSNVFSRKNLLSMHYGLLRLLDRRAPSVPPFPAALRALIALSPKALVRPKSIAIHIARGSRIHCINLTTLHQALDQLLVTSRQVGSHNHPLRSLPLLYILARLRSLFSCSRYRRH